MRVLGPVPVERFLCLEVRYELAYQTPSPVNDMRLYPLYEIRGKMAVLALRVCPERAKVRGFLQLLFRVAHAMARCAELIGAEGLLHPERPKGEYYGQYGRDDGSDDNHLPHV